MPDMKKKKTDEKNKRISDPSKLYEFANDELGENREPRFENLGASEKKGNKKK